MTPGEWIPAFFYLFERTGNVELSAERAGVTRQAVYHRSNRDEGFRERLQSIRSERRRSGSERGLDQVRKTR